MNPSARLLAYFIDNLETYSFGDRVGSEIKTIFVDKGTNHPISVETSLKIFQAMIDQGWSVAERKSVLLTELSNPDGDCMLYELGRNNIELSLAPQKPNDLSAYMANKLDQLSRTAEMAGAKAWDRPILPGTEDLLTIPDERARFIIDVPPERVVTVLNNLGTILPQFLADYPQEQLWRRYIAESKAGYRSDRYGGPVHFNSLEHYCEELAKHDVIVNGKLIPHDQVPALNTPSFLRSVWWYFRLRRFGRKLCIEVRPLPRLTIKDIAKQLERIGRVSRGWNPSPSSDAVRCQCDKCYNQYGSIIYKPLPIRPWYTEQIYYSESENKNTF